MKYQGIIVDVKLVNAQILIGNIQVLAEKQQNINKIDFRLC